MSLTECLDVIQNAFGMNRNTKQNLHIFRKKANEFVNILVVYNSG